MKPLFIPLKREWFEAFERGEKTTEYRAVGRQWHRNTCAINRPVTLSFGYSGRRLSAYVAGFDVIAPDDAPEAARLIYPGKFIAAIHLRDIRPYEVTP